MASCQKRYENDRSGTSDLKIIGRLNSVPKKCDDLGGLGQETCHLKDIQRVRDACYALYVFDMF